MTTVLFDIRADRRMDDESTDSQPIRSARHARSRDIEQPAPMAHEVLVRGACDLSNFRIRFTESWSLRIETAHIPVCGTNCGRVNPNQNFLVPGNGLFNLFNLNDIRRPIPAVDSSSHASSIQFARSQHGSGNMLAPVTANGGSLRTELLIPCTMI
jgi:hypothetical protein